MASDHHLKVLYRSAVLAIGDNVCTAVNRGLSAEKWSGSYKIVIPRSGLFVNLVRGKQILADPNQIIFYNKNESYRTGHPVAGGDRCTAFVIDDQVLSEIRAPYDSRAADVSNTRFPFNGTTGTPATYLKHRVLLNLVSKQSLTDKVEIDEIALDLAGDIMSDAYATTDRNLPSFRSSTSQSHLELADRVKVVLASKYNQTLSLDDMARECFSSPFHLCRVFKRVSGISIHQYLNRLRLRLSLEQIMDSDLTRLALDLGFSGHSHFSHTFRREFGLSPSELRRVATVKTIRKMSKNLTV
jgi:AraC family transcriptional regulator